MKPRNHHLRPRSKRDKSLPYTYEAWVDILQGQGREPVYDHFFSETLCGLIECLEEEGIDAGNVRLFGLFRGEHTRLDNRLCTDGEGRWLRRPELCRVIDEHYEHTHEESYRGHVEEGSCAFEDRDRKSTGPTW